MRSIRILSVNVAFGGATNGIELEQAGNGLRRSVLGGGRLLAGEHSDYFSALLRGRQLAVTGFLVMALRTIASSAGSTLG